MKIRFKKCKKCNNIIFLFNDCDKAINCCDEEMVDLIANSTEASKEKHIPVFTQEDNLIKVKIAENEHPMIKEHYIEWILLETNKGIQIKNLNYTNKPETEFQIGNDEKIVSIYSYCNIHGLWKKDI